MTQPLVAVFTHAGCSEPRGKINTLRIQLSCADKTLVCKSSVLVDPLIDVEHGREFICLCNQKISNIQHSTGM